METLLQHEAEGQGTKDLLRFITCGSVDDGKSTLIGRLLHDSKLIFVDQLAALAADSERQGRVIDHDEKASMEKKKKEGYF